MLDRNIIRDGLRNSIGWKLNKIILIHLFDPLTSMPIIKVKNKSKKDIEKNLANS